MKQHLKYFVRHLAQRPVLSSITFIGFTISILAGLLIYLWVFNELSYEKFHPDYQRIYRVLTLSKQGNEIVKSAGCYRPLAKTLKQDYPQIEYAAYLGFSSEDSPLQREDGGEKIEARELWVNNDFFSIFGGFTFLEGFADEAIKRPSNIILSETVARKLFNDETALGKTVIIDKYSREVYTVAGVVRIPKKSHIDFGFILPEVNSTVASYADHWGDRTHVHVYIKLAENARIDDQFLARIANQIGRYSGITDKLMFQPLADIHLYSDYETYLYDRNISSYKYVWIFSGLAMMIVLMAVFNFSVLSVARASERSTEIGIKKVNGAGRFSFITQFIGESVLQTFVAALLAMTVLWLVLPWFNGLTGKELQLDFSFRLLFNLLALTVISGFLAGVYPSLYLSSMNPNSIFRKGNLSGSGKDFISWLVTVQFMIAIVFIVATSLFVRQLNYIYHKDLGLNPNDVVVVPTGLWYDNKQFKEELMKNPNVLSVSATAYAPADFGWQIPLALNHQGVTDSLNASLFWVDEDFVKTYELEMVKGEFLQMDYSSYWKEWEKTGKNKEEGKTPTVSFPVVINETAEKMMGFAEPVGQRIGNFVVVGVVRDFHFRPLHHAIGPLLLTNDPQNIGTMNIKIASGSRAETLKYIRDVYSTYRDQRGFSYSFFDDLLDAKYRDEKQLKNITVLFCSLAIVISVLGILGMAWFSIQRRTKEIGIRKVNGARVSEVLMLLNKDFLKWVLVAFGIAVPLSWYAMHQWLKNFAYKTDLSWWIFALAGVLALGIAVLTVSWQSWKAATRNPVEALRYE